MADSPKRPDSLERLLTQTRLLVSDLDVIGVDRNGQTLRLSDGLYTERTQCHHIIQKLNHEPAAHFLIKGDAGQGKSSLLWALHHYLSQRSDWLPLLLSASEVLVLAEELDADRELVDAITNARARGQAPILLLDTVDLVLHDFTGRQRALQMVELLQRLGVPLVMTSRPREAELLANAELRRIELPPYTEDETNAAVRALTAALCPGEDAEHALKVVHSAVARGLPIREVVSNPLTLRMWFENAAPNLPSIEADVTSIYTSYWRTRVADDYRRFGASGTAENLDLVAGALGVVMLAIGRPESDEKAAQRYISDELGVEAPFVEHGLLQLVQRGVLQLHLRSLQFFHQTMFEFAAAQSLLNRPANEVIRLFMHRLRDNPDDLFVGAVFEQYLILLGADLLAHEALAKCLTELLAQEPALQEIALVTLAHHPQLDIPDAVLDTVPASAWQRFTLVAPTVRDIDTDQLGHRVRSIWRGAEPSTRQNLLGLLARLASRFPEAVSRTLHELDFIRYIVQLQDVGQGQLMLVPTLLEHLARVSPHQVRSATIALLEAALGATKGRELTMALLYMIERQWRSLSSDEFLEHIVGLVEAGQTMGDRDSRGVREALGRLIAVSWRAENRIADSGWEHLLAEVSEAVNANDESPKAGAGVVAIAVILSTLQEGDPRIVSGLNALWSFAPPKAAWQPMRSAFPLLLQTPESPAAQALLARLTSALRHLPASANKPPPGAKLQAALARQTLDGGTHDAVMIATVLANIPRPDGIWFDEEGLLSLLPAAAKGGLDDACTALMSLGAALPGFNKRRAHILLGRLQPIVPCTPELLPPYLDLARYLGATAGLCNYARQQVLLPELRAHVHELRSFVLRLIAGQALEQRAGANLALHLLRADIPLWDASGLENQDKTLTDAWARATWITLSAEHTRLEPTSAPAVLRTCQKLINVNFNPPRLVASGTDSVPIVLMEAAREAWLQLLASSPAAVDVPLLIALGTAPRVNQNQGKAQPADKMNFDTSLVATVAEAAVRYADMGNPSAAVRLILTIEAAATRAGRRHANQSRKAANRMRGALRAVVRRGTYHDVEELLGLIQSPQSAWGKLLTTSMATEGLSRYQIVLRGLLQASDTPRPIADHIRTELRSRSRVDGSGRFIDILTSATLE